MSQVASLVSCPRTTEKLQNPEQQLAGLSYLQNYFSIFHLMVLIYYKYQISQYSQEKNRNAYYLRIISCTSLHSTQKSLRVTNKYQCCFKLMCMYMLGKPYRCIRTGTHFLQILYPLTLKWLF